MYLKKAMLRNSRNSSLKLLLEFSSPPLLVVADTATSLLPFINPAIACCLFSLVGGGGSWTICIAVIVAVMGALVISIDLACFFDLESTRLFLLSCDDLPAFVSAPFNDDDDDDRDEDVNACNGCVDDNCFFSVCCFP